MYLVVVHLVNVVVDRVKMGNPGEGGRDGKRDFICGDRNERGPVYVGLVNGEL